MMKNILVLGWALTTAITANNAHAQDGMIVVESPMSVAETVNKLETILKSKGMTVFGRVNHGEGAKKVDLDLRATEVLIFGNPKAGTPLMNCSQSIAIDLPQKMLAWEDESGKVFLGYNVRKYLQSRHDSEACDKVFESVAAALGNFAKAATSP